jgi:hypothetical protein
MNENDIYWQIRDRNWGVFSKEEQKILKSKTAVVIGLGCVGELEAVMLARIGIGNIVIIDYDKLSISNLNRNPYSFMEDLDKLKVDNIFRIINRIDPSINVIPVNKKITFGDENIIAQGDVTLQAVDSMKDRIIIHRMMEQSIKKPIITMSGGPPNRTFIAVFDHKIDIGYEEFLKLGTNKYTNDDLLNEDFKKVMQIKKNQRAEYSYNWGANKKWKDKYISGERSIWAVTTTRPYLTSIISVNEAIKILLNKSTVITVPNYYSINLERIDTPVKLCSGAFNFFEY